MKIPFPSWSSFRRWRRARAAISARAKNPLREFLYLDEVSVNSLYASRFGPIPSDYTSTTGWSRQAELGSNIEISAPGIKTGLTPKVTEGQTQSEQVLRKSSLQATFKEWYDFERDGIVLGSAQKKARKPNVKNIDELIKLSESKRYSQWIVNVSNLKRGDLIELEVSLQTARIFRMTAIASEMLDIFEDVPDSQLTLPSELPSVKSTLSVIQRFLVGLIPLESGVCDYRVVEHQDQEYIAKVELLQEIDPTNQLHSRKLYLTGVTQRDLYWKDVRRILFAGLNVRVLARIGTAGLQREWNEVKLLDLLGELDPRSAKQLRESLRNLDFSGVTSSPGSANQHAEIDMRQQALEKYSDLLLDDRPISSENFDRDAFASKVSDASRELARTFDDPEARRNAFLAIEEITVAASGVEVDRDRGPELRDEALAAAGLNSSGLAPVANSDDPVIATTINEEGHRYIESEVVAMYW